MRPVRRMALRLSLVALALASVAAALWGPAYARSASLIVRGAQLDGTLLELARARAQSVAVEADRRVPTRHGVLRAHLYRPGRYVTRAVLVAPGLHALGIDEPRMGRLAAELAATGVAVLTLDLPDLRVYEFTPRAVDQIEDGARWLSEQRDFAPGGTIGLVGISFAGGLALAAAGRPGLDGRLAFVFSFGGYGDLLRTLRFLCTGVEPPRPGDPSGTPLRHREPHDYGVAVILATFADRMVPPDQAEPLRRGIMTFLEASQLDTIDKGRAVPLFDEARAQARALPEPAATLLRLVNERNAGGLGSRLLPVLEAVDFPPSLSPESSPPTRAPVFLLHGSDDTVIPAVETLWLREYLQETTEVRTLVTSLITHAEVRESPAPGEVFRLVSFWADMLRR